MANSIEQFYKFTSEKGSVLKGILPWGEAETQVLFYVVEVVSLAPGETFIEGNIVPRIKKASARWSLEPWTEPEPVLTDA